MATSCLSGFLYKFQYGESNVSNLVKAMLTEITYFIWKDSIIFLLSEISHSNETLSLVCYLTGLAILRIELKWKTA